MGNFFKISEFSALSGISRKLLIYYDKTNILHPAFTDTSNGYRYYSYGQLETACIISQLREAAVPLDTIRAYLSERSPERLIELLSEQEKTLEQQIQKLEQIKGVVEMRKNTLSQSLKAGIKTLSVQNCPEQNLFIGPRLQGISKAHSEWKNLPEFYEFCKVHKIPWGFPIGVLVDSEILRDRRPIRPSRYFFHLPDGQYPTFFTRPAGLYIIGTVYGQTSVLFKKISSYIDCHGYEICGHGYGEYLISVAAEQDATRHLTQISVQIRPKSAPL